jgi:hypothetical protein
MVLPAGPLLRGPTGGPPPLPLSPFALLLPSPGAPPQQDPPELEAKPPSGRWYSTVVQSSRHTAALAGNSGLRRSWQPELEVTVRAMRTTPRTTTTPRPGAVRRATSKGRRHGGSATAPPPPVAPLPLLRVTHCRAGPRGALSTARRSRLLVVACRIGSKGISTVPPLPLEIDQERGEGQRGEAAVAAPSLRALSRPESEL